VGVLLGNGDGTFKTAVTYDSGGFYAVSVAVGDVNGDGKPDLVVANQANSLGNTETGVVGVLLGNGDGTFKTAVTYGSGSNGPFSVAVADVNEDGKLDLLVANQRLNPGGEPPGGVVGVLLGNGEAAGMGCSSRCCGLGLVAVGSVRQRVDVFGKPAGKLAALCKRVAGGRPDRYGALDLPQSSPRLRNVSRRSSQGSKTNFPAPVAHRQN